MTVTDDIRVFTQAKYPILWLQTSEEERALEELKALARTLTVRTGNGGGQDRAKNFCTWSCTEGFRDISMEECTEGFRDSAPPKEQAPRDTAPVAGLEAARKYLNPALIVMKDLHAFLKDPMVIRKVKDTYATLKRTYKNVVVLSPMDEIPGELAPYVTIIELPLPGRQELKERMALIVGDVSKTNPHHAEYLAEVLKVTDFATLQERVAGAGLGLTRDQFDNVIARCIVGRTLTPERIGQEKKQVIKKGGLLEYYDPEQTLDDIGGLDLLKDWTIRVGKTYTPEAERYGLKPPKGVMLLGPPGTGKSLSAKAIATALGLPLVRLDMSKLASSLYGETSGRLRRALLMARDIAPCVLWLDEVEKMFATGGDAGGGHEETQRTMSGLLTFYQENTAPILWVATCNDDRNLRPEFLQRFTKSFLVDLPTPTEREAIFRIHLRKVGRDPAKFDPQSLATASRDFVGREIEGMIQEALRVAFPQGRELEARDIMEQIASSTPMARQKAREIEEMRTRVKAYAAPASSPEAVDAATAGSGRFDFR